MNFCKRYRMSELIYLWKDDAPYTVDCPGQEQPSLKPFPVKGSKGAVVVIPGGGYHFKAPHEGDPICMMLNETGISAYTLDYRVAPCNKFAPLSDANRAVKVLRSMGYEKVAVLGFSAGGNLACNAATHYDKGNPDSSDPIDKYSSRPDDFVPCYAVVSCISHTHIGSVRNLLGSECESLIWQRYFSAEENITPDTPSAFIWHTMKDNLVPVENALNLASAMSAKGVPYEMHIFPFGGHGMGLAENDSTVHQWTTLLQKYLKERNYD